MFNVSLKTFLTSYQIEPGSGVQKAQISVLFIIVWPESVFIEYIACIGVIKMKYLRQADFIKKLIPLTVLEIVSNSYEGSTAGVVARWASRKPAWFGNPAQSCKDLCLWKPMGSQEDLLFIPFLGDLDSTT